MCEAWQPCAESSPPSGGVLGEDAERFERQRGDLWEPQERKFILICVERGASAPRLTQKRMDREDRKRVSEGEAKGHEGCADESFRLDGAAGRGTSEASA